MNFDFLKEVVVAAPEKKAAVKSSAPKLPEGMRIRVFASGRIYPSPELVAAWQLDYMTKGSETPGFGLDIFKSKDWSGFPVDAPALLFCAPVNRTLPKVDLFSSCGYDEQGAPKTTVVEQGGGSFGKTLVTMVQDVFGIEIPSGDFVDLEIKTDIVVPSSNGLFYVPKVISRGANKGQVDAVRRENIVVSPFELIGGEDFKVTVEEAESAETAKETVTQEDATEMVKSGEATIPTEETAEAPKDIFAEATEVPTAQPEAPAAMPAMPDFPEA